MLTVNDLLTAVKVARANGDMDRAIDLNVQAIPLILAAQDADRELAADRILDEDRLLGYDAPIGLLEYDPTF